MLPVQPSDPAAIVITATGIATSLGIDAAQIWAAIRSGRIGLGPMPAMESPLPEGARGGQALDLPPDFAPGLPREFRYLRWVVTQALDAARASAATCPPNRRAVILGTTLHGIRAGGRFLRSDNPQELENFLPSAVARSSLHGLGVNGPHITTCSACSSSLGAVALGITLIESGQADLVIAGGYDVVSEYAWAGFNSLRLVAPDAVRPFAADRQGMMVSEGYAVVVIERASDAHARGVTPLACIGGWGESADAHHLTQPDPTGKGAARAMRDALGRACATPADISMISAHATATPDNDAAEFAAYFSVFGESLRDTPVVGFKSYLGHTLGGAGAVELVLSACALRSGWVPPCASVAPTDAQFTPLCLAPPGGFTRTISRTLNTSLGFGGANTCVILESADSARPSAGDSAPSEDVPEAWITGYGVFLPGMISIEQLNERLASSDTEVVPRGTHASVPDQQYAQVLQVRRMRRMSDCVKLMLASVGLALRHAGLEGDAARLAPACAILASTHGSTGFCRDYYTQIVRDGVLGANPVLFAEGVPNAPAAHVSTTFGVGGSCQTFIGSRTGGLDALGLAAMRIQARASDLIIVGAAEEPHDVVARAYRHHNVYRGVPGRDAVFLTPGSVALILESSTAAKARGAAPIAKVGAYVSVGGALADDGQRAHMAGFRAASAALAGAYECGAVLTSENGTWIDRAEAVAVRRVRPQATLDSLHERLGDLYSAAPLLSIVRAITLAKWPSAAALCTDFSGTASAISLRFRPK
jgi:3-oxoacyl-[acyl-carrier-protein] synthase II